MGESPMRGGEHRVIPYSLLREVASFFLLRFFKAFYSFLFFLSLNCPIAFAVRTAPMIAASAVKSFTFPELLPALFFVLDSFV